MEDIEKLCFVMQRFDDAHYDNLYDQVFEPAIRGADLEPYRVDRDPSASVPIQMIEKQISESAACFAELSEDNPNIWFELGYAIARDKPLCLVCSETRERFPFDVQHRKIIRYPKGPLPKDFTKLQRDISERLKAAVSKGETLKINADTARTLSVTPQTAGLHPHEMLALTIIWGGNYDDGVSVWALANDMQSGGYTKAATNLAIKGLERKSLVTFKKVTYDSGDVGPSLFVTLNGEDWLFQNQDKLGLRTSVPELSDQDIPF